MRLHEFVHRWLIAAFPHVVVQPMRSPIQRSVGSMIECATNDWQPGQINVEWSAFHIIPSEWKNRHISEVGWWLAPHPSQSLAVHDRSKLSHQHVKQYVPSYTFNSITTSLRHPPLPFPSLEEASWWLDEAAAAAAAVDDGSWMVRVCSAVSSS